MIAINDKKIIAELKKEKNIKLIYEDFNSKEKILNYLIKNKNINYLIINSEINGKLNINKFIKKIININKKIIIILINKKIKIKNKIKKYIFILDGINIKKIKEIIFMKKIINIFGTNGVGKSIISILIGNKLAQKQLKILIINNDKINKEFFQNIGISEEKIMYKNNMDIFNNKLKINFNNFDFIIYDNPNIKNIKKEKLEKSINIFFSESNLLGIKKTINLINKNYKIKNNIFIIFNKYNSNSISLELLEKIFNEFKILGKINYDKKIDIILNKNKLIKINKIENDLNKIIEKIIKKNN